MNQAEYENVAGGLMQLARDIEDSKRPGYTRGDDDVLINFKRVGERLGISTEQAWGTYFLKHIDAILSIMTQPDLAVSEEPAGRFADAINYLRLGYALLRERDPLQVDGFDDYIPERRPDVIRSGAEITTTFTAPAAEYSQEFVAEAESEYFGMRRDERNHDAYVRTTTTAQEFVDVEHSHGYGVTLADGSKMGQR